MVAVVVTLLRMGADAEPKFIEETLRVQFALTVANTVKLSIAVLDPVGQLPFDGVDPYCNCPLETCAIYSE